MTIGVFSTALLAGMIAFLFMLGVKKIMKNMVNGSCCSSDNHAHGCGGCGGCSRAKPADKKT